MKRTSPICVSSRSRKEGRTVSATIAVSIANRPPGLRARARAWTNARVPYAVQIAEAVPEAEGGVEGRFPRQVTDVGFAPLDLRMAAASGREPPRRRDLLGGEIDSGHAKAALRQRQREASRAAGDVEDPRPGREPQHARQELELAQRL